MKALRFRFELEQAELHTADDGLGAVDHAEVHEGEHVRHVAESLKASREIPILSPRFKITNSSGIAEDTLLSSLQPPAWPSNSG